MNYVFDNVIQLVNILILLPRSMPRGQWMRYLEMSAWLLMY